MTPIWATGNYERVTTDANLLANVNATKYLMRAGDILNGNIDVSCDEPCSLTLFKAEHRLSIDVSRGPQINMNFPPKYKIVVEKQIKFDLLVMLSLFGGNMGLWLGFSMVQILLYLKQKF